MDAIPNQLLPQITRRSEQSRTLLLLLVKLLLPLPSIEELRILVKEDRLLVPWSNGDIETFHQDRVL